MVDRQFALSAAILASALFVMPVTPARSEVACIPLASITKSLSEGKYHEVPIAHGIAESGVEVIVFAAAGGETWTLIGVRSSSPEIGCLLASGTDWVTTAKTLSGKPL